RARQRRDVGVGEAEALDLAPQLPAPAARVARLPDLLLGLYDLGDLREEPGVDARGLVQGLDRAAAPQQLDDGGQAPRVRAQARLQLGVVEARGLGPDVELQRAQRLQERLLEGPADGHDLADRAHLGAEVVRGPGELLEREARDLRDDVVDGGLEGGLRLLGDVVGQLVEVVADGEEGGDLRDRVARRLRGQGRRARDARVHLDDDDVAVVRVHGELEVRAAGVDADLADDRDGG